MISANVVRLLGKHDAKRDVESKHCLSELRSIEERISTIKGTLATIKQDAATLKNQKESSTQPSYLDELLACDVNVHKLGAEVRRRHGYSYGRVDRFLLGSGLGVGGRRRCNKAGQQVGQRSVQTFSSVYTFAGHEVAGLYNSVKGTVPEAAQPHKLNLLLMAWEPRTCSSSVRL
jgi:hypothetical protein